MSASWQGDWRRRVIERLRMRGYDSATAFVEAHPTSTFIELAHVIGDVAARQLQEVMRDEAGMDLQALERFARNLLARNILDVMQEGWCRGEIAQVGGHFAGDLGDRFKTAYKRVFDALIALAPKGWRPTGPDDPVLLEAFKRWPADPLKAWRGDWKARVIERARERGYPSATSFVDAHPTDTFVALAEMLGEDDVAAVQIQDVMRDEGGDDPHAFEHFARTFVVRGYLPMRDWDFGLAITTVFGNLKYYLGDRYSDAIDRVCDALEALVSGEWHPTGPDDPLLLQAFKRWTR